MAADPVIYCLEQVTDYDQFERLCTDLMAAEGYTGIEPIGGTKDKGRDAIHIDRRDPNNVVIFAYSVREDWRKKLEEDCKSIDRHGHTCQCVTFLCTATYTSGERDEAVKYVNETFGWRLELYGLERLRTLLRTVHPSIIGNHPHIFCTPFFPQTAGVTVLDSRDHLLIDFVDADEALATWLARRLTLEGYKVWCRSIAPIGGSSLNETMETLLRHRSFRMLTVLSPASVPDPDLSARRAFATAQDAHHVIPIAAATFDPNLLDAKTRQLEAISFTTNWASGLKSLLDVLDAAQCPRTSEKEPGIALRSFLVPDVVVGEPETVYANRFQVLAVPEVIQRFTSEHPMESEDLEGASLQWAFRRIDPCRFLSFHSPPSELRDQFSITSLGGSAWEYVSEINGVRPINLVSELLRKSLIVKCIEKGLRYCTTKKLLYFPEKLLSGNRCKLIKPDGSSTFVNVVGQRTLWRPNNSSPYKYQLAPVFSISRLSENRFALLVRIRLRFTDQEDNLLGPRSALSRRKHLCKTWWNNHWLNRTLAVVQFLADNENIVVRQPNEPSIIVSSHPDQWTVPVRINESALTNQDEIREEAITSAANLDEDSDDE